MGDIKLGDIVVNGVGKETKVTHIYPQGKKPVYKVTFSDRTSVLCANDHLWKVGQYKNKGIVYETKSLEDIMKVGLRKSNRWRFRLPLTKIDVWNNETTIDPYLMGVLLGDGCLQKDSISICNPEADIIDKVKNSLISMGYELHNKTAITYSIYGKGKFGNRSDGSFINPLKDYLEDCGLLCKSIDKHIPKEYLFTTIENRIKLLQGLFDTDGWVDDRHTRSVLQFSTSSKQLSDDFAFLVRSLGGTDTVVLKQKGYKKKGETEYKGIADTYEHTIKLPEDVLPFSSKKHSNKYVKPQNGPIRRLVNIEYVGEIECQCIVVESDDHTYITDNETITHNSTVAAYSLCYELYKLMCLKNPNRFYLNANETIWFLFFNVTLKMAEKTMWGKVQKALQMSPWFMERGTVTGRTNLVYQPNKDIKLDIGSTEEHALSIAVMYAAMDEMSFGENDNVEYLQTGMMAIYNQLYLRLSSRFMRGGRIQGRMYLVSSAKSTNAVLESFIRDNEGQPRNAR